MDNLLKNSQKATERDYSTKMDFCLSTKKPYILMFSKNKKQIMTR